MANKRETLRDIPGLKSFCIFGVCWINKRNFNEWLREYGWPDRSLKVIAENYRVIDVPFGSIAWKKR